MATQRGAIPSSGINTSPTHSLPSFTFKFAPAHSITAHFSIGNHLQCLSACSGGQWSPATTGCKVGADHVAAGALTPCSPPLCVSLATFQTSQRARNRSVGVPAMWLAILLSRPSTTNERAERMFAWKENYTMGIARCDFRLETAERMS